MQAALQQWGRAFHHIIKERRSAVIALAEPGSEYLLRDLEAFDSGKEARSFLFTDRYLQDMLTDANKDNTLAQAAKAEVRSSTRRVRIDEPGSTFRPPRYETDQNFRNGKSGRGRRGDRGRRQRANSWLQGGRRYVSNGSRHSTSCEIAPEPYLTLH